MNRLLSVVILLSSVGLPFASAQQENPTVESRPWYQIELIVFENRGYRNPVDPEYWPRDILLAYPMHSRHLLTLEEFKTHDEKLKQAEIEAHLAADPTLDRQSLEQALREAEGAPTEQPFISLDESVYQLKREMTAIDNERDMRVLAHKVWRQPVSDRNEATPVIILGGNQYDEHFELEGSVKVSVSRYLHVDANLWLSSFVANTGQNTDWWPQLPQIPPKFSQVIENDPLADDALFEDSNALNTTVAPWMQNQTGSMQFGISNNSNDFSLQNAPTRNYTVNQLVKLEQSRRMRSAELHYIDHPRFGILVRIDSYKIADNDVVEENN